MFAFAYVKKNIFSIIPISHISHQHITDISVVHCLIEIVRIIFYYDSLKHINIEGILISNVSSQSLILKIELYLYFPFPWYYILKLNYCRDTLMSYIKNICVLIRDNSVHT